MVLLLLLKVVMAASGTSSTSSSTTTTTTATAAATTGSQVIFTQLDVTTILMELSLKDNLYKGHSMCPKVSSIRDETNLI